MSEQPCLMGWTGAFNLFRSNLGGYDMVSDHCSLLLFAGVKLIVAWVRKKEFCFFENLV